MPLVDCSAQEDQIMATMVIPPDENGPPLLIVCTGRRVYSFDRVLRQLVAIPFMEEQDVRYSS